MAVFFLLLVLVVQFAFLLVARQTVAAATSAAARESARPGASIVVEHSELEADVQATVPGAINPEAIISIDGRRATASVTFQWRAPGPGLLPITMTVDAEAPLAVVP